MSLIGKTVYTANAKTNKADRWTCVGVFPNGGDPLYMLRKGRKTCSLPKRCIFQTKEAALAVLVSRD